MTNISCFARILSSAAVAAVFVASPIVVKFDASGVGFVAPSAAFAQTLPNDPYAPPPLPDVPPDTGEFPTLDPFDPPTIPDVPPVGPPINPPTDPVDPPIVPVSGCDDHVTTRSNSSACNPTPVAIPAATNSDNDDTETPVAQKPAKTPDKPTPQQDVIERVKEELRCQTACKATVTVDGDVKITAESKTETGQDVKTIIFTDDATVTVDMIIGGTTLSIGDTGPFGSQFDAQKAAFSLAQDVPLVIDATLHLDAIGHHPKASFDDDYDEAVLRLVRRVMFRSEPLNKAATN